MTRPTVAARRAICAIFLGALSVAANATISVFTNQAAFTAAAPRATTETFEGFPLGTVTSFPSLGISSSTGFNNFGGLIPLVVTSAASVPFPIFTGSLPSGSRFITSSFSANSSGTRFIDFNFTELQYAAGAFVVDSFPSGSFTIEIYLISSFLGVASFDPQSLPNSFVGLTSTVGFNRIRFRGSDNNDFWGLDNLQAAPVPEMPIHLMMIVGIIAIGRWSRVLHSAQSPKSDA